ncbi:hypothetical protein NIES2101_18950 [Calothrix sp. HK-06]|nr:hypothetical protein NIES2101_18950 [Calothrix sp. HK-06]
MFTLLILFPPSVEFMTKPLSQNYLLKKSNNIKTDGEVTIPQKLVTGVTTKHTKEDGETYW